MKKVDMAEVLKDEPNEVLEALLKRIKANPEQFVSVEGKCSHIGLSNKEAKRIEEAAAHVLNAFYNSVLTEQVKKELDSRKAKSAVNNQPSTI